MRYVFLYDGAILTAALKAIGCLPHAKCRFEWGQSHPKIVLYDNYFGVISEGALPANFRFMSTFNMDFGVRTFEKAIIRVARMMGQNVFLGEFDDWADNNTLTEEYNRLCERAQK